MENETEYQERLGRLRAIQPYISSQRLSDDLRWAVESIERLTEDGLDHDKLFNLRWEADMRAIKRWQAATGKALIWPDHADLLVWLMEEIDRLEAEPRVAPGEKP